MTDQPELRLWEYFCDSSYFDMWCVRNVGDRTFGHGFHLVQQDEAKRLCDLLNQRATIAKLDALREAAEALEQIADGQVVLELVAAARVLLEAAERHIFGDECLTERDGLRAALIKLGAKP